MFGSTLLNSCNALLLEQGEDFVVKLANVCFWGAGPFMESVVERLGKVRGKQAVISDTQRAPCFKESTFTLP